MTELLTKEELPGWFEYPPVFLRVVENGLVRLQPWLIMPREQVLQRLEGLKKRYRDLEIVPFARRLDCDDVACFGRTPPGSVLVLHDFASAGWERRRITSFKEWFRDAVNDMLEFE